MTQYVYDATRLAIIRLEPQVPDPVARDAIALSAGDGIDGVELAAVLERLVGGLWRLHERPGGFGELERDRLAQLRDAMQNAFAAMSPSRSEADARRAREVEAADVSDPEDDALDALERRAWDDVGYVPGTNVHGALRELKDLLAAVPADRNAIVGELARQAAAVRQARLGDYSGDAAVGAWRERGYVEPLLLASALRTVGSQLDGGWYPTPERARQLIEQVGVDAGAAALGELVHVAVNATADALGYGTVDHVLADADAYEALDIPLVTHLATAASGSAAVEQLLDDAAHLRRGEVTPAIMTRIDRQSEHVRELAARLGPEDDRTRGALHAEALVAVPLPPGSPAAGIVAESLDVCGALLALFSSEEDAATEEMLADEGMLEPDPDDLEAYAVWEAEVQDRTTASWLTVLSVAWDDRQP